MERTILNRWYKQFFKRLLEIIIVLITSPLWIPILLVTMLLVRTNLGSPVFFCQKRPGKNGKLFKIIKFRTMTNAKDPEGNLLPDPLRQTSFGKALRRLSLDELPELLNVLLGNMSLVGPRPLLIKYLPLYTETQMRRHDIRPGITGLAQIRGRNNISWEDKFKLDVWYVDHHTLLLDIKILVETIFKVKSGEGVIEPFTGSHQEFTGTH
jgi:lipopolysaccharide/colanic/teichoic acid biosynthesis glycosyltransferase